MILGADHLLPNNYIETMINRMESRPKLVIASGKIDNEWIVSPRGSGRLIKTSFFKKVGSVYPINWGFESYILYKALQLGYEIDVFADVLTETQRPTSTNYKPKMFYNHGKAMQALGYPPMYAVGRCLVISKRKGVSNGIAMYKGFLSNHVKHYEKELRDHIKQTHKTKLYHLNRLLTYIFKKPNSKQDIISVKKAYSKGKRAKIYGKIQHPLRDKLREHLKKYDVESYFEFGCNAGYNLSELHTLGKKVFGIDINEKAIKYGKDKLKLDVGIGDEKSLSIIPSETYDLVFTSSVLDHVPKENIDDLINNLKRISKKYLICLETKDELHEHLFSHDYEKYDFKPLWQFLSTKASGGNGCLYKCYEWQK
jgi:ubiquinone/menaquinone biosynthesis C-methylase UbiE